MTTEELDHLTEHIRRSLRNDTYIMLASEFEQVVEEVKRLWGIQNILADCREESSAWADGYRMAVKDAMIRLASLHGAWENAGLRAAAMTMAAEIQALTPESSLAKQRQKEIAQ